MRKKYGYTGILLLLALSFLYPCTVTAATRFQKLDHEPVIVIDPGHGGDNDGTLEGVLPEKVLCRETAMAMYEELSKFDGITIYMTRTEDIAMSLKERAAFAAEREADFLFSIHYNASECHALYGSEVWVGSFAPYNQYGYQFGYTFLDQMKEKGLLVRGVKTKRNDRGSDYYGIIREAKALDIPAAIIEHCHVDEDHDRPYCDSVDKWREFGVQDAHAVAKYFGLSSAELGIDYSDYALPDVSEELVKNTMRDLTPPEKVNIHVIQEDVENGILTMEVFAEESDSIILYYDYSIDGGQTYSARYTWEGTDALAYTFPNTIKVEISLPENCKPDLMFRVYNQYDLEQVSNRYQSEQIFRPIQEPEAEKPATEPVVDTIGEGQAETDAEEQVSKEKSSAGFLQISILVGAGISFFVFLFSMIHYLILRKQDAAHFMRNETKK